MKIDRWVEWTPVCAGCNLRGRDFERREHGYAWSSDSRREAEKMAKAAGWKVVKGKTFCPNCAGTHPFEAIPGKIVKKTITINVAER